MNFEFEKKTPEESSNYVTVNLVKEIKLEELVVLRMQDIFYFRAVK